MRHALLALAGAAIVATAAARNVSLSNVVLPTDTSGAPLTTGEVTVLAHHDTFYVYLNDWGGCGGVDCCPSGNCASCCFNPPSSK
jgi:hypothetical protein